MQEKVQEVQESQQVVGVAVTKYLVWVLLLVQLPVLAAVLPEDRADALYHSYSGGGVDVVGPSIIVRKKMNEAVSVSGNYYVDSISSASIDVVTTASPYTEERVQKSLNVDVLHEKTLMSAGFIRSVENDFDATTFSFSMSQDMFGDLTNVGMGVSLGSNIINKTGDQSFEKDMKSKGFHLSVAQVLSKHLIVSSVYEVISDEGFLNNPYRSVRYVDITAPKGYSYQAEAYPNTRTSNAFAIRAKYHLPYQSAIGLGYRVFSDSWGIKANTYELSYSIAQLKDFIFDFNYRSYDQTQASFYSDLFPYINAQQFLARDKELSSFSNQSIGFGVSHNFINNGTGYLKKASVNFNVDQMSFDYKNFKDLSSNNPVSTEPLYSLNATVYRLFVSIWF